MDYIGTRGAKAVSASSALVKGIADDGGLYVPAAFPDLSYLITSEFAYDYKALAFEVLKPFLSDFADDELRLCIERAYDDKFTCDSIAPVVNAKGSYFLELFHGPTLAFKDMALSILPHFMKEAARKCGIEKKILILTATSGDTGKAALEGFSGVNDTCIAVLYPEGGISDIQKLQMTTQTGDNTYAAAVYGNFDDAQRAVKRLFCSSDFNAALSEAGYVSSSANSINIGRLLPQIVYYFWAYKQMANKGEINKGERINFTVPTGNFGNILAGYYAKKMGLPVAKLICASNENNVLSDFLRTGIYNANRRFYQTVSPSMDILISSNLERLLFDLSNADQVKTVMNELNTEKKYVFAPKADLFEGVFANTAEALEGISEVYEKCGYVMDTHTAIGYAAYKKYGASTADDSKNVILATASPYKFARDVLGGIYCLKQETKSVSGLDGFEAVEKLSEITGLKIPVKILELMNKPVLHKDILEESEIEEAVINFVKSR